jgi:altronate dehydratase
MEILGYLRPDGQVGIRNYVAIVYTTHCALVVAQKLQALFPVGTRLFGYPGGCALRQAPFDKIVSLGQHSSIAAALVVGLGCEGTEAHMTAEAIAKSGRPAEAVRINECGGDIETIAAGSRILTRLLQYASQVERVTMAPADLIIGCKCGGSDATSGLASNPATGAAGDRLIEAGGRYMVSEVSELLGCGEALAARAVNAEVGDDIKAVIAAAEEESFAQGRFSWGYGNILGGLTSIDEKSAGALAKSGSKPLQGVLRPVARPSRAGLWVMVADFEARTFSGDPETINQFAACGAHLAMFTTGCGSTAGGLIPVVKVIANVKRSQLIADNADFDASPILRGDKTVREVGGDLYEELLRVAAGKLTKSEIQGHWEA